MLFLCPPNKYNQLQRWRVLAFYRIAVCLTLWSHLMCTFFLFSLISGQSKCKPCPPDTYAMLGASKCLPLPNCTTDDIIDAPGDLNTCSCTPPQSGTQCNTTVHPYFVTVQGELTCR